MTNLLSKCCNSPLKVSIADEGTGCYICNSCCLPTDPIVPNQKNYKHDLEILREEFEELFPKDQEAIDGIRRSKSNRSAAIVLWAKFDLILTKACKEAYKEGYVKGAITKLTEL